MSRCDSYVECSNISFIENKLDSVDLDSNVWTTERTEEKFYRFWPTVLPAKKMLGTSSVDRSPASLLNQQRKYLILN